MNKIKKMIFIKDNKIIDCVETTDTIANIKSLYKDCECREVSLNTQYYSSANVKHFDKDGKKYNNKELIEKKLLTLKKDEKLNETTDAIEKITDEIELIENGIKQLNSTQKIITDDNGLKHIVEKTQEEKIAEGLITTAELKEIEKQQAIARLQQIDIESIRPLRADVDGTATEHDYKKLHELDVEANSLRELLK